MKILILCQIFCLENAYSRPKLGFSRDFTPEMGSSNGSSGVLVMSLSATVPEKSRGNKKCDKEEEEEKRHVLAFSASL